jgi:hypothetical protein
LNELIFRKASLFLALEKEQQVTGREEKRSNPFATLGRLKKKRKKTSSSSSLSALVQNTSWGLSSLFFEHAIVAI